MNKVLREVVMLHALKPSLFSAFHFSSLCPNIDWFIKILALFSIQMDQLAANNLVQDFLIHLTIGSSLYFFKTIIALSKF